MSSPETLLHEIPQSARPMFRYWFPPDSDLDPDAIRRDMEEIAGKGFGGAELKCEGGSRDIAELGTRRWQEAMTVAMETLYARGCRADFGNTAGQFIVSPAIRSVEDPGAAQELTYSKLAIPAGSAGMFLGEIPRPEQRPPMKGDNIKTKSALVCVTAAVSLEEGVLDRGTLQEITSDCVEQNGCIRWNVPDDRPWMLFFHWKRARNETQPTRLRDGTVAALPLLDFYNRKAVARFMEHWLRELMTPRMLELASAMGSCMFSDNVENAWERLQWSDSEEIFSRFFREHGYDLAPLLVLLYRDGGGFIPESEPHFVTRDPKLNDVVLADFSQAMTRLYIDHYVTPVREALHRHGMRLRIQTPYGTLRQEQTMPACYADIPETESLWMGDSIEGYLSVAGAVHMSGKHIYSSEIGANMGEANRQTWLDLCHQVERNVMGGVNLSVLHGYGYSGRHLDAHWPGWSCMAPQFSNDWGPRTPQWIHAGEISAYLGRLQALAQWGEPAVDVAILRLAYKTPRCPDPSTENRMFPSDCLRAAGYTYEYVSPGLLENYPQNFRYKALLVSRTQMELPEVRETVTSLQGIPIYVYKDAGTAAGWLRAQGIHPSAVYQREMPCLYSLLRRKGDESVRLFYNDSSAELRGDILLNSTLPGHIVDLWTGEDTDAFGTLRENRLTLRLPPRTTCAVLMDGVVSQKQSIGVRQMWIPDKWNLMLTMLLPGSVANTSCLETVQRKMDQIASWSCLTGLEYTSGIGEYSTAFEIERVPVSATLLLDGVTDTFDVRVNGHSVPCNQAIRSAEIGSYLSAGQNELRIRVSSPLYNQLLEVQPERYGTITLPDGGTAVIPRQFYGIDSARLLICFPK